MTVEISKDLFPYQVEGAHWLACDHAGVPHGILADEMGLGKTLQAIAGCDLVNATNILVVCPGIARDNWAREFDKWQQIQRTICMIKKSADKAHAQVVITSYTALQSRPVLESVLSRKWDVLICDEAHLLKNPQALTTMVLYGADCTRQKGVAAQAKRVWLLTGTPFPNGPHEIWTHASALFPPAVQNVESYNNWIDRFCYWKEDRGERRILNSINVPEMATRLKPFIKRRLVKDVLPDLPPLRFGHVVVAPNKVPAMDEATMEADLVLRAALARLNRDPSPEEMAAIIEAEKMHIASLLRWTGVAKAPAVAEAIRTDLENGLKKLVVFAHHQDVFAILQKMIPGAVAITGRTPEKKIQPAIDAFQREPDPKVLLLEMTKGSTAITLTAADTVAFVETGWVVKDILQAVKRCHRIGQDRPVLAKVYSLKGSLDEAVSDTIVRKHRMVSHIETQFVG